MGIPRPANSMFSSGQTNLEFGESCYNMEYFLRKNLYKKGVYLIRLTRGYTDGGMDRRPDENRIHIHQQKSKFFADGYLMLFRANVRSAVHVSMREAG